MANTTLLREVADYIEQHPKSYSFDWNKCVAGRTVRLDGARFIASWDIEALRPKASDPRSHVRSGWAAGDRYVTVRDRARRLLGINAWQANHLFMDMPGVTDKGDVKKVVTFVRNYADYLDAMDAQEDDVHYIDWMRDQGRESLI